MSLESQSSWKAIKSQCLPRVDGGTECWNTWGEPGTLVLARFGVDILGIHRSYRGSSDTGYPSCRLTPWQISGKGNIEPWEKRICEISVMPVVLALKLHGRFEPCCQEHCSVSSGSKTCCQGKADGVVNSWRSSTT